MTAKKQETVPRKGHPMQWWRGARFGMFIHWGLYAATRGYWKGNETAGIGEWIMHREKIPLKEYQDPPAPGGRPRRQRGELRPERRPHLPGIVVAVELAPR